MDKKEFINYFKLLGVSYDASKGEITAKVIETVTALNDKKKVAYTEEERNNIDKQISLIAEANKCLQDSKARKKHLEEIAKHDKKLFIDDEELSKEKSKPAEMTMDEQVSERAIDRRRSDIVVEDVEPEILDTDETGIALSSRAVKNSRRNISNQEDVIFVDADTFDAETVNEDNSYTERPTDAPRAAFSTRGKRKYSTRANDGRMRVEDVEESEEAVRKSNTGRKFIIGATVTVLAATIILLSSHYLIDYFNRKKNEDNSKDKGYSIVQEDNIKGTVLLKDEDEPINVTSISNEETTVNIVEDDLEEEVRTISEERDENGITYRGDATDPKVVNDRVEMIADYFNKSGIYNFNTMQPYTKAEIKDIILFVNGAYVPKDEADVYSMVDNQMNFIAANASTVRNIDMVNYMANSDVVNEKMVAEDINKYPNFNFVDAMLLGDSSAYPYLKWFNGKYNDMVSTTNKEESRKIFAEMSQSLADLVLGDGYTIDGVTYTIRNFEGLGNINDGNILMMLVNMFSVYNTRYVKHDYVVKDRVAGEFSLTIDQVASQFDIVCSEDLITLKEDDVLPEDIIKQQDNYHRRLQIDTIECALTNGQLQNQEYYKDQYTLSR